MSVKLGCIGCGNMGGAILGGLAARGGYELSGYTRTMSRMDGLAAAGVARRESAAELARGADIIVLAVKPYQIEDICAQIRDELGQGKTVVSIAAGVSLATLRSATGSRCPVVRCMPNTPALVGAGVFALCFEGSGLTEEGRKAVTGAFAALGECFEVPESRFTAFTSLIGAGPAYLFDLMEGMVQAGVTLGFGHAETRRMVAALFAGCGKMALEKEDSHLMALRDGVCSPAGTTIAGVNRMDADGLAGKLAQAVFAAQARGLEMEK